MILASLSQALLTQDERHVIGGVAWAIAALMLSPRIYRRFKPDLEADQKKGDRWYGLTILFLFLLGTLIFTGLTKELIPLLEAAKDYLPGGE